MPYTPMSDLGQQGLFDITRTLLQQPDLGALSDALTRLVRQSALADSAAIVLWHSGTQRASYYSTRDNGKTFEYEDETYLAHGPVRRILSRPEVLHCNFAEFRQAWPKLAESDLYQPFGHYCMLPLAAEGQIFWRLRVYPHDRPALERGGIRAPAHLYPDCGRRRGADPKPRHQ